MSLRQLAKRHLPQPVFRWMKSLQAAQRNKILDEAQGDRAQIFSSIYRENMWGTQASSDAGSGTGGVGDGFYSGHGSHYAHLTQPYIDSALAFIQTLEREPNVVDLGCGDFSVGSRIRPACAGYIAGDVVPELIDRNRVKFADLDVDFRTIDMVMDELPAGDIVFIREVFQHLSSTEIAQVLPKLSQYSVVIITELLPIGHFVANLDKPTGFDVRRSQNSGVIVTEPPFDFAVEEARVLCEMLPSDDSVVRAMLYRPSGAAKL